MKNLDTASDSGWRLPQKIHSVMSAIIYLTGPQPSNTHWQEDQLRATFSSKENNRSQWKAVNHFIYLCQPGKTTWDKLLSVYLCKWRNGQDKTIQFNIRPPMHWMHALSVYIKAYRLQGRWAECLSKRKWQHNFDILLYIITDTTGT